MGKKKNKKAAWLAEYAIYRVVETAFRLIPVSSCYQMGAILGGIAHDFVPKRRRMVLRNLTIAFGHEKSAHEIRNLAKQVFETTTGNLLASIKTATMSTESFSECVTVENGEDVAQFTKENNGAIYLLPHMGNWEAMAHLENTIYKDVSNAGMYRPLNNPYLDALVKERREGTGSKLFARNDGMSAPLNHIRNKGLLGILADQRVGKSGQITPFFGRLTSFSPLPQIFKKRTSCGVLSVSVITTHPGHWIIRYTKVADKNTELNTGDVAHAMEQAMRESPADCFWLQDRWKLEDLTFFLAGKLPVIKPLQVDSELRKQVIGIFTDENHPISEEALIALKNHRPDFTVKIYSPSQLNGAEKCPNLSEVKEFEAFLQVQNEKAYIDIFIVPHKLESLSKDILTRVQALDYDNLLEHLHQLGLPESPIC